jgi:hypothetical protein
LELITIRHFNQETLQKVQQNKTTLLQETLRDTVQLIVRKDRL